MLSSSNPALRDDVFNQYYGAMAGQRSDVTTIQGVVNKTAILGLICIAAGTAGYALFQSIPQMLWITAIGGFIIAIGIGFVLCGKPQLSPIVAPIYAVVEGLFLGSFTALADSILEARGSTMLAGVGVQAFIITAACFCSMLVAYKTGLIKPTRRFKAVLVTLTGAIMIAYMVSFVVSMFGVSMPLISFGSAVSDTGMMGFLGLGINLIILIVASLFLIIDFEKVEMAAAAGAPKYMEWYCAYALLVTLAWIYFEAVKLVLRLYTMFGRD